MMPMHRLSPLRLGCLLLGLWVTASLALGAGDEVKKAPEPKHLELKKLPAAFTKTVPESVEDLKTIQDHVKDTLKKLIPCVVNVRIGQGQGSGVIISEDGYVLTAGHVSGQSGRDVVVTLHDGRRVKGKTLGGNPPPWGIDSGLIKITDEGKWPHVHMGKSAELKAGQWCIAIGHPGGYKAGRSPVVRVGRILDNGKTMIRTDCTLVGGDSGGPLFDMHGRVIGIHSKIDGSITYNIHVPVDTYRDTWDRLARGEVWGGGRGTPYLGVECDPDSGKCKVTAVREGSPAEKAGLKVDDIVTRFHGHKVGDFEDLRTQVQRRRVGEAVMIEVLRGDQTVNLKLIVGKR
ncbi:MAG: S1C family serine protease [Gemmataceae bacterium]|nr:S1C family serine protease [Gemmataceae bacterium]